MDKGMKEVRSDGINSAFYEARDTILSNTNYLRASVIMPEQKLAEFFGPLPANAEATEKDTPDCWVYEVDHKLKEQSILLEKLESLVSRL